jgi:hypothetical protein
MLSKEKAFLDKSEIFKEMIKFWQD